MLDSVTLRFQQSVPLRPGIIKNFAQPEDTRASNWYYQPEKPTSFKEVNHKKACLHFNGEGDRYIRLFITDQLADGFSASLSNFLFGKTGSILTSQDELNRSMEGVFGESPAPPCPNRRR